jgi:hypothetical protein
MAFLNLEKVGRDFTLSGKEFHNFIVEGKKDLELLMFYRFVNLIKILMFYHFVNFLFAIILTSVNFQVSTNYKKNLLKFD